MKTKISAKGSEFVDIGDIANLSTFVVTNMGHD